VLARLELDTCQAENPGCLCRYIYTVNLGQWYGGCNYSNFSRYADLGTGLNYWLGKLSRIKKLANLHHSDAYKRMHTIIGD
jgi:hypothetical protein